MVTLRTRAALTITLLAGSALATPPTIEVIYSRAPGSPTSVVPGAVDTGGNPVTTNFNTMSDFWLSPDGTKWLLKATTTQPNTESDNLILLGGGLTGTMLLQEGRPFPGAVGAEVVDFISTSNCAPFNTHNDFALAVRAKGGVASVFQKIIRYTGGVGALRFQMGDLYTGTTDNPIANAGNETIGNSASCITLRNDGVIGWHDPNPGNCSSTRYPVAALDAVRFLQSNADTVTRIDGSGSIGLSSISSTGTISVFWPSIDGTRVVVRGKADVDANLSSLGDPDCVVVDGQIQAQVSQPLPADPSLTVSALSQTYVASNNNWFVRGNTSTGAWVVRNGTVIAKTGMAVGSDTWASTFLTIVGGGNGSWAIAGKTSNPDPAIDDVLVVNGQILLREGDPVSFDIDGDGQPDTAFIGRGNNTLAAFQTFNSVAIAPDGKVYSLVNLRTGAGADLSPAGVPTALLRITPAPTCGSADFNCDGDVGTDADIEAFFSCLAGNCPAAPCTSTADFNSDGDIGTDADIEAFFRVLGGGTC
jgi:hypothetical protein